MPIYIFHLIFPALNSVNEHYYEDDIIIGWWNDWEARDQRARIEKTFKHGRFSREKRTLGLPFRCYSSLLQLHRRAN